MPHAIRKLLLIVFPCVVASVAGCTIDQLGDVRLLYGNVPQKYAALRRWFRSLCRNAGRRHGKCLLLPVMWRRRSHARRRQNVTRHYGIRIIT